MPSANFLFNVPLFKKNVSRFWPLWGLYTLGLFLVMPFYFLIQGNAGYTEPIAEIFHEYVMSLSVLPYFTLFYAIFAAMALWSYLYNSRATGAIHALPLRRETVFFTNYLTGLLFFLLPNLFIVLLSLLCQAVMGGVAAWALGVYLLCQSLMMVFFFSFATLLAFVTGHILTLPVLYVIFNVLFMALSQLLQDIFRQFVYGFYQSPFLDWIGERFTPVYWIQMRVHPSTNPATYVYDGVSGLEYLAVCAAVGLVMAGLSLLLYRRRKLELAGEVIAVPFLRPVFKYGVGICGGLTFGYLSYGIFSMRGDMIGGFWGMLLWLLLWGAIFYLATAMLIRKSFRVFRQEWRGCGILLLVLVLSMAAMEWDLLGVERRVPEASRVLTVSASGSAINNTEYLQYDPDFIEAVVALHEIAAASKREVESGLSADRQAYYDYHSGMGEEFSWDVITIRYGLKNGAKLYRMYEIPLSPSLLADESSLAYAYDKLVNHPTYRAESAFPSGYTREMLYQAELFSGVEQAVLEGLADGLPTREEGSDPRVDDYTNHYFTRDESLRLYDAVQADLKAGTIGYQYLLRSEVREHLLVGELSFSFRITNGGNRTVSVTLSDEAAATLAVLEELGFRRGAELFTQAEYDALWDAYYGYESNEAKDAALAEDAYTRDLRGNPEAEVEETLPQAVPDTEE